MNAERGVTRYRTIWISDVHLGTRGCQAEFLLDFLRHTEGTAIRRVSFGQWQRNLAVALGNGPADPAAIAALRNRRSTADALLAEHIDWALVQLERRSRSSVA